MTNKQQNINLFPVEEIREMAEKQTLKVTEQLDNDNCPLTFRKKLTDNDNLTINGNKKEVTTITLKKDAGDVRKSIKDTFGMDISKAKEQIKELKANAWVKGKCYEKLNRLQRKLGKNSLLDSE